MCRAVITGRKGSRRWEALRATTERQHRSSEWVRETQAWVEQKEGKGVS